MTTLTTTNRRPVRRLQWRALARSERFLLARKLEGLYGFSSDEKAFDALATDKQRALLLLAGRFDAHRLWQYVRRAENVYGVGGVGLSFMAWPGFFAALARHRCFRPFFCSVAFRRCTALSFRERNRPRAALHVRRAQATSPAQSWSAHFDVYNPLYSPAEAWRHFFYEVLRRETPDWQAIDKALREG